MRTKTVLVLVLTLAANSACLGEGSDPSSRLEHHVNEHAFAKEGITATGETASLQSRMAHHKVPGMSLAVIDNGAVAWETAHGFLRAGQADMVDGDTLFQAGSVTKFVTALIVMHHVEKGVFDLDVPANTYLESWKIPQNEFNREQAVTLRHLLSHQSGIPGGNIDYDTDHPWPSLPQILAGEHPALNPRAEPEFTPGSKWSYSNIGYAVLQLVLEDRLGQPIEVLAREIVFEPLKMASSTFEYPLPTRLKNREAFPHSTDGDPLEAVLDSNAIGQGGLFTTTRDMSRLLIEMIETYRGESEKVVSAETLQKMLVRQVDVPGEVLGFSIGMGLGVFVDGEGETVSLMHPGHSFPGTVFIVLVFPALGEGMAMGANGNIGDRLEIEVASTLAEIYDWPSGRYFPREE